ncbi:hypothetical protein VTJ83DRAFT_2917 [Remersonia thermophila]|uniref:Uncharacterized protein n=1 Tax=Remersonia thermophila TaxID=72144 RepID=A0ABR4DE07_9PEZI
MGSKPSPAGSAGVDAWFDNRLSSGHKEWLISKFYQLELNTIRRPKALLDPGEHAYSIHTVGLYDRRQVKRSSQIAPQVGGGWEPATDLDLRGGNGGSPGVTQSLLKRLRDHRDEKRSIDPLGPAFAKLATAGPATKEVTSNKDAGDKTDVIDLIDDDDNDGGDGGRGQMVAGPNTPLRLELRSVRQKLGYQEWVGRYFGEEMQEAQNKEYRDLEQMLHGPAWTGYVRSKHGGDSTTLVKGFPMVEEVVFLKHRNQWSNATGGIDIEGGQCYWVSIALLLYGTPRAWLRVKAEHLSYLERAVLDKDHPRHEFYTRELQSQQMTRATSKGGSWQGPVNLWEMLQLPGCWVSQDVGFLTADVYGVFLVVYKYGSSKKRERADKVYDMKTFGPFNARHIFLCYINENHYQPMVPNDYYAYEFRLPRLTLQATRKYHLETCERTGRFAGDGPKHHYRSNPKSIPGVTVQPWFTREHLTMAVGYGPGAGAQTSPIDLEEDGEDKKDNAGHENDEAEDHEADLPGVVQRLQG